MVLSILLFCSNESLLTAKPKLKLMQSPHTQSCWLLEISILPGTTYYLGMQCLENIFDGQMCQLL